MEDQGKRLLLAVVIALGIMLAWNYLFPPKKSPEDARPDGNQSAETSDVAPGERVPGPKEPALVGEQPAEAAATGDSMLAPAARAEEKLITLDFPAFRATFTNYGGNLLPRCIG